MKINFCEPSANSFYSWDIWLARQAVFVQNHYTIQFIKNKMKFYPPKRIPKELI